MLKSAAEWISGAFEWFRRLFGIGAKSERFFARAEESRYIAEYEDIGGYNIVSAVAGKLANLSCAEARIFVEGDNPRAEFLNEALKPVADKLRILTARALGTGGIVLKPYAQNGRLYADILPQNRFFAIEYSGEILTKAGFAAAAVLDGLGGEYVRVEYHTLTDGTYAIENKAVYNGREIPLETVPAWAGIPPSIVVGGVEKPLFGVFKCPVDNRRDNGVFTGVPITYGCDKLISEIAELLDEFQKEFKLKRAFIGADLRLFNERDELVKSGLYKRFSDAGGSVSDKGFWEEFSPDIRVSQYIEGINFKYGQLEKAIGVNKGVLTDQLVADATATAIEYSSFDTEAFADSVHKNIEAAFADLVYAFDVIANAFNLAPPGKYELKFDWMNWSERAADRWKQLFEGVSAGAVRPEELRMYLFDEDIETAVRNMPELAAILE